MRNLLKKEIRNAKKNYYQCFFEKYKNTTSKIWEDIRSVVNINYTKNLFRMKSEDDKIRKDPQKIENFFQSFFKNIGPDIAKKIPKSFKIKSNGLKTVNL